MDWQGGGNSFGHPAAVNDALSYLESLFSYLWHIPIVNCDLYSESGKYEEDCKYVSIEGNRAAGAYNPPLSVPSEPDSQNSGSSAITDIYPDENELHTAHWLKESIYLLLPFTMLWSYIPKLIVKMSCMGLQEGKGTDSMQSMVANKCSDG